MAKKIKHSKVKNTGVLFELLVRQITNDTINGLEASPALKIVKEFFGKNTALKKELSLYNMLLKEKFTTQQKGDRFLTAVLTERSKISNGTVKRQKYNLIKEISKHYNLDNFFRTKISDYKVNASIYKLFESQSNASLNNPKDIMLSRDTIVEHISSTSQSSSPDTVLKEYSKQDKAVRLMGQKILLEKFNAKYGKSLNKNQSRLLKEYINNVSDTGKLSGIINRDARSERLKINNFANKIDDKIISIKLLEVSNQLRKLEKTKTITESYLTTMMNVYELSEEMSNVIK
jgi:HEPN domain-containing protein